MIAAGHSIAQIPKAIISMDEGDYKTLFSRDVFNDEFLPAKFKFNGTAWNDVEIRFKGKSKRYFPKKSFRIKFPKKHLFNGVRHINLHAMYNDRSFLVEKLAYDLFHEMNLLAPDAGYIQLNINQQSHGVYLLVDRVNADFLKLRGRTASTLYNTDGLYALADLTEQSEDLLKLYYPKEIGDTNDYVDLKNLIYNLNRTPDSTFESVMNGLFDMKSVYNWLAGNIVMMMGDSYNKNYYLYRDESRKINQWSIIPWDYDIAFGQSGDLARPYPNSILNDGFSYTFPPLSGPDNVLKNRFWAIPGMHDKLRLRVDTLLHTVFTEEHLFPRIDSLTALISEEVNQDTLKRGTFQDYLDNVEAVKKFIACRKNFLLKTFIHQPGGTFNMVTLPIEEKNFNYHFVEVDGRTIATMRFTNLTRLDSVLIIAHADMLPPGLNAASRCVKRWLEIVPFPSNAAFSARHDLKPAFNTS